MTRDRTSQEMFAPLLTSERARLADERESRRRQDEADARRDSPPTRRELAELINEVVDERSLSEDTADAFRDLAERLMR